MFKEGDRVIYIGWSKMYVSKEKMGWLGIVKEVFPNDVRVHWNNGYTNRVYNDNVELYIEEVPYDPNQLEEDGDL